MIKHQFFLRVFLVVTVLIFIVLNVYNEDRFLLRKGLLPGSSEFPGKALAVFKPYLQNVRVAGYWSDVHTRDLDVDIPFMYLFQHIQVVLAPTFLDHYSPLRHEYIIVNLSKTHLNEVTENFNAEILLKVSDQVALLRRKGTL